MSSTTESSDVRAIEAIIDRQFGSLEWSDGGTADWDAFFRDFHDEALLYPAARPSKSQSVADFAERMKGLTSTSLPAFKQKKLGSRIHVFGNVAVALAACENDENGERTARGVEAMLLIKEDGDWKIVSQSWDMESDDKTIPDDLMAGE